MSTALTPEEWQQVEALFHDAQALGADERRSFVESRTTQGSRIRAEVLSLLAASASDTSAIEPPDSSEVELWMEPGGKDAFAGMCIGDCTLEKRIGQGGMGVVYEAWQDPPGRRVAVKLLRDALGSDDARFRFQHEARVLGSLRHPAIAQIYRVGTHRATTEIPYFLMEHVAHAVPITEFVKTHGLEVKETLALAVRVCRGVHAGHARGVIHRDLKPGNILVDPEGNPKVIDFGIARVAEADEDERTPRTNTGQLVGTVPYMSPEQVGGVRESIDIRSDVYALGVILYELLTDRLPVDIRGLGVLEVIGAIRNRPPDPPARVRPELAGDVSVILLKALAKEPDDRYGSAEALADDIVRFLEQRPILAQPPKLLYQMRLYARRHKAAFLAMVGVVAVVIGSLIAISLFAAAESRALAKSQREEARARVLLHASAGFVPEITDHLDNKLSEVLGATRVRRLLAEKVEALATKLAGIEGADDDPEVLRALGAAQMSVANIKGGAGGPNLGEADTALSHYQTAIGHFEQALAVRPVDDALLGSLLAAKIALAGQHRAAGRTADARRILGEVEAPLSAWLERCPDEIEARGCMLDLVRVRAAADWYDGNTEAALAGYLRMKELADGLPWDERDDLRRAPLMLQVNLELASTYAQLGRDADSARHVTEVERLAQVIRADTPGLGRLWLLWHVHDKLGDMATGRRDIETAKRHHEQALEVARTMAAGDPRDAQARTLVQSSQGDLGAVFERLGDYATAEGHMRPAVEWARAELQAEPNSPVLEWDLRVGLTRLASIQSQMGKLDEARRNLDEARVIQERRIERSGGAAVERSGLAEVEATYGVHYTARALPEGSIEQNIEAYEQAEKWFRSAVRRLKALQAEGTIPPPFVHNIEVWSNMATLIREQVDKLAAMKR